MIKQILRKLYMTFQVMTHKHVYLIPFHGEMTEDEVTEQALNITLLHYLAKRCEGWKGKTQDDLEARMEMIKSAMSDKNVIMLSEHEGKYYTSRSVESSEMADKLAANCFTTEEAEEQDKEDNEPKVGDSIVVGVPVKVAESKEHSCEGCAFENADYCGFAPEPKYRPFKDDEECWNEMQNHQPFGWIKSEHGYYQVIGVRDNNDVCFSITGDFWKFGYVFDSYTFADGTPFGIKEEK